MITPKVKVYGKLPNNEREVKLIYKAKKRDLDTSDFILWQLYFTFLYAVHLVECDQ